VQAGLIRLLALRVVAPHIVEPRHRHPFRQELRRSPALIEFHVNGVANSFKEARRVITDLAFLGFGVGLSLTAYQVINKRPNPPASAAAAE
jgi:hypothetical protein